MNKGFVENSIPEGWDKNMNKGFGGSRIKDGWDKNIIQGGWWK